MSGYRRSAIMMFMLFGLLSIPSISAHNYLTSPSRALVASVSVPCQARVSPFPHIQVIPGQSFPMEWTVGHGDSGTKYTYLVLINANDYQNLYTFDDNIAEDYIALAPSSAYIYPITGVGSHWAKRHIGNPADTYTHPIYTNVYFDHVSTSSEADYIVRDAIYREKSIFNPKDPQYINQWVFHPNQTTKDVRVAYRSAKYPWIRAVHRFYNSFAEHQPYAEQVDIANFEIPTTSEPGQYIYHYKWGGYRDCVDIEVRNPVNGPVALPFGKNASAALAQAGGVAPFVKLDHCEYNFVWSAWTNCHILPKINGTVDVTQCVNECSGINSGPYYTCTGVQLVRATNPANVILPYAPNIPYYPANFSRTGYNYPCDYDSVNERIKRGCNVEAPVAYYGNSPAPGTSCSASYLKPKLAADDYVCYGTTPYRNGDLQTIEDYTISTDPQDPKYYSSCWVRVDPGGFLPPETPLVKFTPSWTVGDQCMSCSYRDWLNGLSVFKAPIWTDSLTTTCRNCDQPQL